MFIKNAGETTNSPTTKQQLLLLLLLLLLMSVHPLKTVPSPVVPLLQISFEVILIF
jgi:hypothetical protein